MLTLAVDLNNCNDMQLGPSRCPVTISLFEGSGGVYTGVDYPGLKVTIS